ncbi:MAG TPA: MBL fold metallo-hydrolase [Roseomonas sp.]|jgi:ribonuclease Z
MLRLTMLGTGAALLDPARAQTSLLVTVDGRDHLLLDCGNGAARRLVEAGVSPSEVDRVLLTHLHVDHTADLASFTIGAWMLNRPEAFRLYGPAGTRRLISHLLEGGAFDIDIRARAGYPLRQRNLTVLRPEITEYGPGVIIDEPGLRVTAGLVDHIPEEISPCYGFRIEAGGRVIAFSGDTTPTATMVELARGADVLVHDCTFPEAFLEHRRQSGVGTSAHTSPRELGRISAEAGVKLLVPSHFGHFDTTSPVLLRCAAAHLPAELAGPHQIDAMIQDIRESFAGPVLPARDLLRIEL